MTTSREAWADAAKRLAGAGIESARLDARVLLAHAMGFTPDDLLFERDLTRDELSSFFELLARRLAREPVAYITGEREFWSLTFEVGPGALIPRPETETLIEESVRHFPDRTLPLDVLDLGTGSGCLLIAFLHTYPQARGVGVDRSREALEWARKNAAKLGITDRAGWLEGDWTAGGRTHDVILANPPYLSESDATRLAPEIAEHEPRGALVAGPDGLEAYRALAPLIVTGLNPGGCALLEIGAEQAEEVAAILKAAGLEILGVAPDLGGTPRCIVAGLGTVNSKAAAEKTVGNDRSSR